MGLPILGNENASVRPPLSMEPLPLPCHPDRSEAEWRDLRFLSRHKPNRDTPTPPSRW